MSMRTCLFVGGPADGTWHEIDTNAPAWRVAVPLPMPVDWPPSEHPVCMSASADYKPVSFHFGYREFFICQYIEMNLDPLSLLHHICAGYRK
jgi:hypothetical protein